MIYLVCIAGLAAAIVYRGKAPLAFTAAIGSLALLLALAIVEPFVEWSIYKMFASSRGGGLTVSNLLKTTGLVAGFLRSVGIGGLAAACFLDRGLAWPPTGGVST